MTGLHELAALEYEVVRSLGARLVLDVVTADIEHTTILGWVYFPFLTDRRVPLDAKAHVLSVADRNTSELESLQMMIVRLVYVNLVNVLWQVLPCVATFVRLSNASEHRPHDTI